MSMSVTQIRAELLAQHAELRALVDRARRSADRATRGADTLASLTAALSALAEAVDVHNRREEELLGRVQPRAAASAAPGDIMDENHVQEHKALHAALVQVSCEPAEMAGAGVQQLLDQLMEHMEEEESEILAEDLLEGASVVAHIHSR